MSKAYQIVPLVCGIVLIAVHGFWPTGFTVDALTILILAVISVPMLANYLRRAKFWGGEFEFKDEIRKTQSLVEQSVKQATEKAAAKEKEQGSATKTRKPEPAVATGEPTRFETFRLATVENVLDSDPVLALAALRIEIENRLKSTLSRVDKGKATETRLSEMVRILHQRELLTSEQRAALNNIIAMCNQAIHGAPIKEREARQIVSLARSLNKSFSTGYSIDFSPNDHYAAQGLSCEWEHCIEHMPLSERRTSKSCPMFGHDCPGGSDTARTCKRLIDPPKRRFVATS